MTFSFAKSIANGVKLAIARRGVAKERFGFSEGFTPDLTRDTAPAVLVYATDQGWHRVRQRMDCLEY
jgi:hypothetical protein